MLDNRSMRQELMDEPRAFDRALAERSFRFIERVNRLSGATALVWRFVREEALALNSDRPLRILDIGAGMCDIPAAVCRRAAGERIQLQFTCVEKNRHAVDLARRMLSGSPGLPVTIVHEDIIEHRPDYRYDIAVASMFFHHFSDESVMGMITRIGQLVHRRLLISDLERCWPNYLCAALLCLPESAGVRNDALLSVRRGFRIRELQELFARVPAIESSVGRRFFYRIAALITFQELVGNGSNNRS